MTHPLIPPILELATPIAQTLDLEVVNAVFQTNQRPPVLRIDVRNRTQDTGLVDCEQMSRALEPLLDESGLIPDAYVLEVSSPGLSQFLSSDRDFLTFKGFPVIVSTSEPHAGQTEWTGNLVGRDQTTVQLNLKGRSIAIPRDRVIRVQLTSG